MIPCDARKCKLPSEVIYVANGRKAALCGKHWTEAATDPHSIPAWIDRRCIKRREKRA